ncbi:hypothetical protein MKW98_028737 [Papaver atlanticum]|uniref:Uncharacterized protein n=1 Tax=Papaver atlanticum TaxID=357466 RepID=A0AAD4S9P6_9MAGN|nr:hypothetical protein MKW98_028737 [Papaver atlanticum]
MFTVYRFAASRGYCLSFLLGISSFFCFHKADSAEYVKQKFRSFAPELLLGEGEFGRTYKGCLKSSGQVVAVRQVNRGEISSVYRYRCMEDIKPVLIQSAKRALVGALGGKEFTTVADPLLKGRYPEKGFYQALSLAAECLHPSYRTCCECSIQFSV